MNKHISYLFVLGGLALVTSGCGSTPLPVNNTHQANVPMSANENQAVANTNRSSNTNIDVPQTVVGQVFVKSYGTPSESYGVLATNGQEIGMGAYDSMKEELRPYVGKNISVTFSSMCNPTLPTCCRTVFTSCGFVKSWKPVVK